MNDGRDHDGNQGGPDRGHRHGRGQGHGHGNQGYGDGRRGPLGTEFLDLEISQVAYAEASALTREAARAILRGAIEARLRERLGPRLEALGRIAADEMADDVEANLDIEARIAARRDQRQATESRARAAMHAPSSAARGAPRRKGR